MGDPLPAKSTPLEVGRASSPHPRQSHYFHARPAFFHSQNRARGSMRTPSGLLVLELQGHAAQTLAAASNISITSIMSSSTGKCSLSSLRCRRHHHSACHHCRTNGARIALANDEAPESCFEILTLLSAGFSADDLQCHAVHDPGPWANDCLLNHDLLTLTCVKRVGITLAGCKAGAKTRATSHFNTFWQTALLPWPFARFGWGCTQLSLSGFCNAKDMAVRLSVRPTERSACDTGGGVIQKMHSKGFGLRGSYQDRWNHISHKDAGMQHEITGVALGWAHPVL